MQKTLDGKKTKTVAQLMKELEELKGQVADLKSQKTDKKTDKKTPTWEQVDRKVTKEKGKPVRYFLIEKMAGQVRVVVGRYSKPVVEPRGEILGGDAGWFKTTTNHYGKKTDAYYIPKVGVVLNKSDVEGLLKAF